MQIKEVQNGEKLLDQIVTLGTKNSRTLGHFPEGAFREYARKGNIICACNQSQLGGYVLFSVSQNKNIVRLVHLCVDESHRSTGIAKLLLDYVKDRYSIVLKGISLSCREDYKEASKFWERYGFKAIDRVRSKSKKEKYLIKWWYDFGNDDLFSLSNEASEKIKALLDANILIKLRDEPIDDQTGTKYLNADWLVSEIDYYYAPETFNEILRDKDKKRADETRSFVRKFCEAKFKPDIRDSIFIDINNVISGTTKNDISDKKQLAECIAGDIEYFITIDSNILDSEEDIFQLYGIQVLNPTDFILMVNQINNKSNYVSTRIAGVDYEYKKLEAKKINPLIDRFLNRKQGEKKHQLRDTLTSLASDVDNSSIKIVRNKNDKDLGFWASKAIEQTLEIPAIRVLNSRISPTLFKQLIYDAINYGRLNDKNIIVVSDPFLNTSEQETLESFGFILKTNVWIKVAIRGIVESQNLFSYYPIASQIFNEGSILEKLTVQENIEFRYDIERNLWPLKFSDLDIPAYIIPIKPHWASQLFDHHNADSLLFGAPPEIAWRRENIYYRSERPVYEDAPARILWYLSKSKNSYTGRDGGIVACSYLDETHVGEAKSLYRKFKKFGVYSWKDISKLAGNNTNEKIKALKFSDTEVFEKMIPFSRVTDILTRNGRPKFTFTSPLKVDTQVFIEIYKLGAEITA